MMSGNPRTGDPAHGRLAILCDGAGRIAEVLCDDAGLLGPRAAGGQAGAVRERMLSGLVAPGGAQHFAHLLARVSARGAVSEWLLDMQRDAAPLTYRLWAARDDTAPAMVLILGTTDPGAGFAEVEPAASGALAGSATRVNGLVARMRAHALDPRAQLEDLREQVRELQEQVQPPPGLENRLLRMAAHDLRNPLLVLSMGCSYLLHEAEGLTEDQRGILSESLATCEFMNRLVDGMVDLAEVAVGRLRLARESTDLAALLEGAMRRSEQLARERGSAVELVRAASMSLAVDPARMAQVFGQLLSNALIHCPTGTRVQVWLDRGARDVVVAVADDGPGIPSELRANLFRPFGKPHGDIDPKYYGAGVGLAVARRIVEAHDGHLDVETEPGRGSCFRVMLPLS